MKNPFTTNDQIPDKNEWVSRLDNYLAEVTCWQKMIACRIEKNLLMKDVLSCILQNNSNNGFLEEIENFQTRFILEDETYTALKRSAGDLDEYLMKTRMEPEKRETLIQIEKVMATLRGEIENSDRHFQIVCTSFKQFQSVVQICAS
ncbi:MAG: hypothetical protein J0H55_05295 [Chitinophagaceae bacterium]|nr:hypothetical protein [Chitinophagaceae bacterium]